MITGLPDSGPLFFLNFRLKKLIIIEHAILPVSEISQETYQNLGLKGQCHQISMVSNIRLWLGHTVRCLHNI
jgi:hypothetical protein